MKRTGRLDLDRPRKNTKIKTVTPFLLPKHCTLYIERMRVPVTSLSHEEVMAWLT